MAARPAELAGLPRKGQITAGFDADFCVFAPDAPFTVDPARLHHRQPGDPLRGPDSARRGPRHAPARRARRPGPAPRAVPGPGRGIALNAGRSTTAQEGRLMRILVVNVNTSESMTEVIAEAARRYASPGTEIVALQPYFGAAAVDCIFESYLSAVAVMDRVLAYDRPLRRRGAGRVRRARPRRPAGAHRAAGDRDLRGVRARGHDDRPRLLGRDHAAAVGARDRGPAALAGLADRCASVRASGMSTLEVDSDPAARSGRSWPRPARRCRTITPR